MSHTENILGMLSSTIDQRNDLMITPSWVAKDMVEMLPKEVWNKDTTFLDPACKSGIFLHEIYLKLMETESLIKEFPDKAERRKHILHNQLFGIALNPMCQLTTARTVYGTIKGENNIKLIDNYITIVKNKDTKFFKEAIKEQFGEMKFNVVIGNPPYQDESGRSSIYNKFVEKSIMLASIVSMITRDNWMNGKAFKSMRDKMMNIGGISSIVHYPKVGEVFKNVSVTVTYFIWQKGYNSNTHYICIRDNKKCVEQELDLRDGVLYKSEIGKSIINKVGNKSNWTKYFNTRSYPFMDQRKRYNMESADYEDEEHNVAVMINSEKPIFVSSNYFSNLDEVYKYKVMCGVIINEASVDNQGNVLTNIKALPPMQVASETWSLIATFDTELDTVNCKKYIMTRFVRFIANQSVNGRSNVTDNTFECVPLQDFTSSSDINWSQSIADIDQQLYKKYNLTEEEIAYIEKTIKPMQ